VRRPLIEYLKTSTELVKQTRWEFPAFANPSGRHVSAGDVELTPDEVDAMMSHAFERYFQTSGLFGTPEMCLERVRELRALGVDEIACLVDFGIATDTVLSHLPYLDDVRQRSRPRRASTGDYTIAAQIVRHGVTHLQGTPSLIRTVLADERGRAALSRVTTMLVGGEPLPPALAVEILDLGPRDLLNMYGPTETTVWSSVGRITDGRDITIGRPIANTQMYIVDGWGNPRPIGVPGELLIGGLGVTRGYWQRPALTAERFVSNPCLRDRADTLYRSGDVARYRPDGRIECLGRVDHQVKISGHRIELGEIEAVLGTHPDVAQSVVVVKPDAAGESRLVAYVVPNTNAPDSSSRDVLQWQAVWEETYGRDGAAAPTLDPTFDISGWRSSYTGEAMPDSEMREWLDATVSRVLSLAPRRILEVGCGTGLLLHRLAPSVESYVAVDFSQRAVARVRQSADARGLTNVTLHVAGADALTALADLPPVDVVILNSVVQYFPDVEYLLRVLEQAVSRVAHGGAVFVGDVRNLLLLEAFHASVELAQAPASLAAADLRQRVRDRVQHDPELVIAPGLFRAIASRLPMVTSVDILLKRGRAHNEMTCYRYDAILRVGGTATSAPPEVDGRGFSMPDVRRVLATARDAVTIRGLGNPRLRAEIEAVRLLASPECPETVAALRHQLEVGAVIEPEDLVAEATNWEVDIRYAASGALDEYDATFRSAGVAGCPEQPATEPVRPWSSYVHQPRVDRGQLVHALKQHLRARVPAYMVPAAFMLLESIPLTPNGKIDRNALPEPDRQRQEASSPYVAPSNDVERVIAETWQDLLALDGIGAHDNFFDIGANSLLMVQAHTALREKLGRPVSLVDLFRFPTVSALAAFLGGPGTPGASAALTESETRAQARTEALNRRRQGRHSVRDLPTQGGTP
jgi:acyl-CoA synthetase (AMP-forming)/AMP-acid ligase II/acyl carrier protein